MQKRKQAAVVRFPKFAMNTDDYFYSMLFMLLPHRNETDLLIPYSTLQEAFLAKRHLFQDLQFTYFSFGQSIEQAIHKIHLVDEELNAQFNNQTRNQSNSIDPAEHPLTALHHVMIYLYVQCHKLLSII